MCRMIGFASAEPLDLAPFLAALSEFSSRGNLVDRWERRSGGNHPDGWGIAYRAQGEIRLLRSGKPANADPCIREVGAASDRFIGHVRYASDTTTVNASNAHPFLVGGTALAHNGTFRGKIGEEARRRNVSDTLVFLERLSALWEEKTFARLGEALAAILCDAGQVGDYSAANLLVASGNALFALRHWRRDEDYYTLFLREKPGLALAASQRLDDGPGWRPLRNGELVELIPDASRSAIIFAAA
ncbi:MAG: class II glutamine amidotransferase [Deltaproteobacteria bacterium]